MTSLLADPTIRNALVPISVAQYHLMGEAGIIDSQTELLRGIILKKMIKSPLHTLTVKKLVDAILPQLQDWCELRKEEPLTLAQSELEPDIALVTKGSYDPTLSHPSSALLVIEVALSSEAIDRAKATIYASAGIPEYWLVLPEKQQIERFAGPEGDKYLHFQSLPFTSVIESSTPLSLHIDLRLLS